MNNESKDRANEVANELKEIWNAIEATTKAGQSEQSWWSVGNAMTMSSAVLLFGIFVFILATYLIRSGKDEESVLRILGTILIVVCAVFLVVAGYSNTQIAPVIGLLGTIAGYLLGKESSRRKNKTSPDNEIVNGKTKVI